MNASRKRRSCGMDMVPVERIKSSAGNRRFLDRVFTQGELAYSFARKAPHKHLAVRFAAKEACLKALATGLAEGLRWKDIEVEDSGGRISLRLHGKARERLRGRRALLSVSCGADTAVAFVVME